MGLIVVVALYLVIGSGLGIAAFRATRRQAKALDDLSRQLDAMRHQVARLSGADIPPPVIVPPVIAPAPPVPAAAAPPPETDPWAETIVPPPAEPAAPPETMEEKLGARWMLRLGAATLALGGVFLVKYVVDEGWFGPTARCAAGFLLGTFLLAAGEWLRRRPPLPVGAMMRPATVPPALTAAGVSIAFTSAYAAFELYALLPPLPAFLLLGLLSMGAVFLSLLQGPFVALLGLAGGFATPLLVAAGPPSALGLFLYLLFVVLAAFMTVRFTRAWWLGLSALAGAAAWLLLWVMTAWQPGDAAALGGFLLALLTIVVTLPLPGLTRLEPTALRPASAPGLMLWLTTAVVALFTFVLLRMDAYGPASLSVLTLVIVQGLLIAFRIPVLDRLSVLTEALALAALAAWHVPRLLDPDAPLHALHPPQIEAQPHGYEAAVLLPPQWAVFLTAAAGFAALLGGGGFLALWWARRPAVWAAVAASAPVLLLTIAYARVGPDGVAFSWAVVALALAALNVVAAARVQARRTEAGFLLSLAAFAAAAVAAIALGATMTLREAWLTVALALELPALAWIADRLAVPALRKVALVLAVVVLTRLVLNVNVVGYALATVPVLNWVLYGYGLPCVAFFAAARWFRRGGRDMLVVVLEAGALVFATLLVTLELHTILAGGLTAPESGLLEPSLRSLSWLALAVGLSRAGAGGPVAVWGRNVLAGAAVVQIVALQVLMHNPLWSPDTVGSVPVLNLLLLAYGLPAGLLLWFAQHAIRGPRARVAVRLLCLVLVLVNVTLEVRRGFQGGVLSGDLTSDAEWYSYSLAWLALALVLLALGIRSGSSALRYASLGLLVMTVAKVFLSDMGDLTGLYRAASFVGLGFSLIGVGYLYQRFVLPAGRAATSGDPPSA